MQCYRCMKAQDFDLARFFGQWCTSTTRKGEKTRSQICWLQKYSLKVLLSQPTDVLLPCIGISCPILYPIITFPRFFLSVFLLFLLRPVTRGSSQDQDPTVPDTTQNLVRPNPCAQKQTESEGNQEVQTVCDSFTFFFWQDTSKPLNSVTSTSLSCCSTLNSVCVLHWIPCVSEAVQQLERENVGAQHRHCVIWIGIQRPKTSKLGNTGPSSCEIFWLLCLYSIHLNS